MRVDIGFLLINDLKHAEQILQATPYHIFLHNKQHKNFMNIYYLSLKKHIS